MQRGMRPFRVTAQSDEARDVEARDMDHAREVAAKNLIAGTRGIKSIEPLSPDEVRTYEVQFADRFGLLDTLVEVKRDPVKAKSSREATMIAQAEIDMGEVPDAEMVQAMVVAVSATPLMV